uniref:Aquaporin-8 n=1 Tax=Milnesium tardigradum TaxID=46460 RepID=AQP8_MILTA|nr:RecName: Full=Aquaporin-8; Short=AQP-8 [Milnesium tardigradum]AEP14562.1 aquaporin 8 [Milnesium tardigradum]
MSTAESRNHYKEVPTIEHYSEAIGITNRKKMDWRGWLRKSTLVRSQLIRGCMAEFLAVFVLMVFIEGSAATAIFTNRRQDILFGSISSGLGVAMAVYVAGGVSGAFLNPAVALAFAVLGKLSWKNCIFYMISQYLAAFVASCTMFAYLYEALNNFDGGERQMFGPNGTAHIWSTYPQPFLSPHTAFADQVFCTAILLIVVLAMCDSKNWKPHNGFLPIAIGLLIITISCTLSYNAGAAMNPSRDLAPRFFSYLAGYGTEPFGVKGYTWFFVPVLGSHCGAIIGGAIYQLFIGGQWPDDTSDTNSVSSMSYNEDNSTLTKRKQVSNIVHDSKGAKGSSTAPVN